MPRPHHGAARADVLLQHGVVGRLAEGAEGIVGRSIAHGIVRALIAVGRVHHIIGVAHAEDVRALRPAAVGLVSRHRLTLPLRLHIAELHGRLQQQLRLADDAAEVGLQFYAIHPALLNLAVSAVGTHLLRQLAVNGMLVAAAREVEVGASRGIVKQHVGVDDGIGRVEHRTVHQVAERPCRAVADGHANAEHLKVALGIVAFVGAVEEIVLAVPLIDLGRPEAVEIPLLGRAALVDLSARLPLAQVVANESLEAVAQRGAIHIIAAVRGMQDKGVAQFHIQRVRAVPLAAATTGRQTTRHGHRRQRHKQASHEAHRTIRFHRYYLCFNNCGTKVRVSERKTKFI